MHRDALAASRVADDRIAGDGLAAGCDRGQDPLLAADEHARRRLDLGNQGDGAQVASGRVQVQRHAHHHCVRRKIAVADRGHEVVDRRELVQGRDLVELVLRQVRQADAVHAVELLVEQVMALGHVLLAALALEPLADPLLGRCALDEVEPVAAGPVRSLGGEDLDDLAVLERVLQRHHPTVDLGADAVVTDLRVDAIREVHGRRVGREVDDIAARRENVDLVLEEIDLDGVQERLSVPHLALPFEQAAQPGELLVEARILPPFLICPVGGDAELGHAMHLLGSDLDLDGLAGVGDDSRVQRLVAVRLRHGDVVLEPPGHGLPERVDDAEDAVAIADRVDEDADGREVVDLGELLGLAGHLLPDGVHVLRPAGDVGLDANLLQLAGQDLAEVGNERLAVGAVARDAADDVFVRVWLEVAERQVLELPLDLADAEPVRERRVDVEGLARDLAPLRLRQRLEGAHVVQPVGELDEDHAEVLRHRDHHLADVLGLLLLVGAEGDPAQLGHAVDQARHLGTELALDLLGGQVGVLDRVVEQGGRDRRRVQLQVGEDGRHLERVVDVVLARQPVLAAVGQGGALVRLPHHHLVLRVEVVGDPEKLGNRQFLPDMKFKFAI